MIWFISEIYDGLTLIFSAMQATLNQGFNLVRNGPPALVWCKDITNNIKINISINLFMTDLKTAFKLTN